MPVPFLREIKSALLNPVLEVGLRNPIRIVHEPVTGLQRPDRRVLISNAIAAKDNWVRRELRAILRWIRVPLVVFVIKNNQRSTFLDKLH